MLAQIRPLPQPTNAVELADIIPPSFPRRGEGPGGEWGGSNAQPIISGKKKGDFASLTPPFRKKSSDCMRKERAIE